MKSGLLFPAPVLTKRFLRLTSLALALAAVVTFTFTNIKKAQLNDNRINAPAAIIQTNQRSIYLLLATWAQEHNGQWPDLPGPAEANFRAAIPAGTPASNPAPFVDPDGYATAYIAGQDGSANSQTPLLITARIPTLAWLTGQTLTPPDPRQQGHVYITAINGCALFLQSGDISKPLPLMDGPNAPSLQQIRFSGSFHF